MNQDIRLFTADGSSGDTISSLRVDGGASENDLLMQMQSDISGIKVVRPISVEATAAGAAYLAGLAVGFYKSRSELCELSSIKNSFTPKVSDEERQKNIYKWHKAIKACREFAAEENP